jgi:hypothetical protein
MHIWVIWLSKHKFCLKSIQNLDFIISNLIQYISIIIKLELILLNCNTISVAETKNDAVKHLLNI